MSTGFTTVTMVNVEWGGVGCRYHHCRYVCVKNLVCICHFARWQTTAELFTTVTNGMTRPLTRAFDDTLALLKVPLKLKPTLLFYTRRPRYNAITFRRLLRNTAGATAFEPLPVSHIFGWGMQVTKVSFHVQTEHIPDQPLNVAL